MKQQELHLYFEVYSWETVEEGRVIALTNPITYRNDDRMSLGSVSVTFPEPKHPTKEEFLRFRIGALQEEKKEVLVKAQKKVMEIEQCIQELSAITYNPEVFNG